MTDNKDTATTGGKKPVAIILAVLIVAALGAGGYLTTTMLGEKSAASEDVAMTETASGAEEASEPTDSTVIARVGDEAIKIADVKEFVNNIPQLQGQPIENVFPIVQEQLISSKIVSELADKEGVENDPEVARRLELAKTEIIRAVFVEKELDKAVTEAKLQTAYKEFLSNQPKVEEVRARHILVEKEETAKDLIAKLEEGADFAELAKENSTGPTGPNGGDLGYFADGQMVPEFSDAAFALEKGAFTKEPVKTQFGYHVIKLEDKRMRPDVPFEQAKGFLEAEEKKKALNDLLASWREGADIEVFDINGNAIEPAAGE